MTRHIVIFFVRAVAGILLIPALVSAQTPSKTDLAVLYDLGFAPALDPLLTNGGALPAGWALTVARPAGGIRLVAEVSGSYKAARDRLAEYPVQAHSLLGGLRVQTSSSSTAIYAGLLAGVTDWRIGGWFLPGDLAHRALTVQPGGGVERALSSRLAWRAEVHAQLTHGEDLARALYRNGGLTTSWHARAGVAVRLGGVP